MMYNRPESNPFCDFSTENMYRELITSLNDECEFNLPATFFEILAVEEALGTKLPDELKALLKESNGVSGHYGTALVWSTERIISDNLEFRNTPDFADLYMPFDCLLFIGDYGNGDQFAYSILNAEIRRNDIFEWNHEDDSRTWAASNLKQYLEKMLKKGIN